MTLNASGPISLGGATTGQSINLELGVSATALASINSAPFRNLAGVASGAISLSNFYGKSNITLSGALPIANGGTGNIYGIAVSAPLLQTTNFTISESGGVLVFKYGATTIATMDSTGNLTTLNNMTAYGSI